VSNTPAYYIPELITIVKSFMIQALDLLPSLAWKY